MLADRQSRTGGILALKPALRTEPASAGFFLRVCFAQVLV